MHPHSSSKTHACTNFSVSRSIYAVPTHDSLLDYATYRTIMASSGIHFTEEMPAGIGLTSVDGIMCVPERVILLSKARAYFETELEGVLQLGRKVSYVDDTGDGVLVDGDCFDFVVDATWGHYRKPNTPVIYEPTLLLYYEGPSDFPAVTLVDGPLCSVYPTEVPGLFTLSSVPHTPLGQFETAAEARIARGGISADVIEAKRALMEEQIMRYLPIFPKLFRYVGPQLAIKTKSISASDDRSCQVSRQGRIISVLSGKIDAVFYATERILSLIEAPNTPMIDRPLSSLRDDIAVVSTRVGLNE